MDIGGAEKSLLGILENIDTTRYQVDLFLLRHEGELLKYIPTGINLMPADPKYSLMGIPLKEVIKRGHFRIAYKRYIGKKKADERLKSLNINTDNNIINEYSHKYTVDALPQISQKEYDLAISFMSPHYYVAKNVNAKKKVAWPPVSNKAASILFRCPYILRRAFFFSGCFPAEIRASSSSVLKSLTFFIFKKIRIPMATSKKVNSKQQLAVLARLLSVTPTRTEVFASVV